MSIERIFLGWSEPALATAARRLVEHYRAGGEVRMERATVVLAGGRAGRRLRERLLEEAERRGARLVPPRVTTIGALPELLYEPERALADPVLARRVWVQALRGVEVERLATVFPMLPAADDVRGWTTLARQVERLHREVGGGGLRFDDVVERCSEGLLFDDGERWRVLAEAQRAYLERLRDLGHDDREAARLEALARGAVATEQEPWLVGIVDVPAVVRRMLEALDAPVRALVHAPEERADAFDAVGCVVPEAWREAEIPIADERLRFAERPADQATEALHALAALGGRLAAEEIAIGVPDEQVVPYLEQRLSAEGVPVRYAAGEPLAHTAPYRLLAALAAYLDGGRFEALAELVRHPDVERWLKTRASADAGAGAKGEADAVLGVLDRYHAEALPAYVAGGLDGGNRWRERAQEVVDALASERLLGRFGKRGAGRGAERGSERRRLAQWAPVILELLVEVYGDEPLDRGDPAGRRIVEACERIRAAAAGFHRLPEAVDEACDAVVAVRLLLDEAAAESIAPDPDRAAVEMLGWLELHLDDASALVVTGLNEPFVPESVNADAFLPNALRSRLGLTDNERRYARDAYSLTAILEACPRVWLIAGRRDAEGNPLRPSRLLFAAPARTVAERVRRFFDGAGAGASAGEGSAAGSGAGRFQLPPEPEISAPEPIEALRVTDFRALLQDPYRFALERVLGLGALDDEAREMDGALFGSLAHDVLNRFGVGDAVHLTDEAAIARRLDALLDDEARRRFGRSALPAVHVQVEQLRARLHAFAAWHAAWVGAGWRVAAVEVGPPDPGVPFDVDGRPVLLRGRIDRIDHNPATGEWAVFDYKTSDAGLDPERTHRRGRGSEKRWVDLQLPLYLHLLPALTREDGTPLVPPGATGDVRLGYLLLPRELGGVGAAFGEWGVEELDSADDAARDVVRALRENRFVFDPERASAFPGDPLAPLLGLGQLAGVDADDEEGGDA